MYAVADLCSVAMIQKGTSSASSAPPSLPTPVQTPAVEEEISSKTPEQQSVRETAVSHQCDYTKSRLYAWTDLSIRLISAIALAALGVAGWLFQTRTEDARQVAETQDRAERKYLPLFRSLIELEFAFNDALDVVPQLYLQDAPRIEEIDRVGRRLGEVSYSVFLPDGDPPILMREPSSVSAVLRRRLPLRSAAIMVGELIRLQKTLHTKQQDAVVTIDNEYGPSLRIQLQDRVAITYYISRESVQAWKAWFENDEIRVDKLASQIVVIRAIEDVARAASEQSHAVAVRHVDIADRYVAIRAEVFKPERIVISDERRLSAELPK